MFTGIVEAVGKVVQREVRRGDLRIGVATGKLDCADVSVGDSIAVNGICLTVVALTQDGFAADVSGETLACTTLAQWQVGERVNLEKAMTPSTRLGGHLVSGHVDGIGEVRERRADARSVRLRVEAPAGLARYIATKGSICVDGVSLTVNEVNGATFDLNIVPHTLAETIVEDYQPGCRVNIEVDLVARYLERLLLGDKAAETGSGLTREFLRQQGIL